MLAALAFALCPLTSFPQAARDARADEAAARSRIEAGLRAYFAAERADGPELRAVLAAARGRDELLAEVVRTKSFVAERGPVDRSGIIDGRYRFRDVDPGAPVAPEDARGGKALAPDNRARFSGPAVASGLAPLVVYVPDSVTTAGFSAELAREREHGRFVFLVPDEEQDNEWNPSPHEHRRHTGPLRDFLLAHPIDPDRVFLVGSGRGGHATWDVGLLDPHRFAALFPCNGGAFHEGGFKASGGVFLENARSLAIATVYNTSFDHGIDSCRLAGRRFAEWGYRFTAVEEPEMRTMEVAEAMQRIGGEVRDPHPREIRKRFNRRADGAHFWLRALDRVPDEWEPTDRITLRGEWPDDPAEQLEVVWAEVARQCARLSGTIEGDRVRVEAHGVGRVRVYFDPELVAEGEPLTVTINGKAHKPFTPKRAAEVMLEHVHATGDTARLYWAFRDFDVKD